MTIAQKKNKASVRCDVRRSNVRYTTDFPGPWNERDSRIPKDNSLMTDNELYCSGREGSDADP
jgi:hypothetical protein